MGFGVSRRIEFHYTPKHGSWLNMAEIEISIFQRGCLSRRVDCLGTLRRRINTRERTRNQERCPISWQFTTNEARLKLPDLYPDLQNGRKMQA
jgi:hypothetical protein